MYLKCRLYWDQAGMERKRPLSDNRSTLQGTQESLRQFRSPCKVRHSTKSSCQLLPDRSQNVVAIFPCSEQRRDSRSERLLPEQKSVHARWACGRLGTCRRKLSSHARAQL